MPTRPSKAVEAAQNPTFADLLATAKLPEITVPVCMRADLAAEHDQLDRELTKLIDKPSTKFGGDGRGELKQRIEALEAEMQANTYPFRLRGMSRPKWKAFVAEHPPRKADNGDPDPRDAAIGVDISTFFVALIRRSLVDPELIDEQWADLMGKITDRQFDTLADAAWGLNRKEVDVPFSAAVYKLNRSSEPESN